MPYALGRDGEREREREGRRDRKRKRQGLQLRCNGYMGFPKMKGTILGGTYNKDYIIFQGTWKTKWKGGRGGLIYRFTGMGVVGKEQPKL